MRITLKGKGDLDEIAQTLRTEVPIAASFCELVHYLERGAGSGKVCVAVFERYYTRVGNRASLITLISGAEGEVTVDAVASGGGRGSILRFNWGAEKNFASIAEKVLAPLGFETVEKED